MAERVKHISPMRIIQIAVVAIIVISACAYFFNLNGGSFDFSESELMIVPTGSMDAAPKDYEIPTIPEDSLIMAHRLSDDGKNDLKIGDVITFNQDGIVKVHRIIDLLPDGRVVTKGDANLNPDVPITHDDIIGKVVGVSPIVGKVVSFIKDTMAGNPMLFIVAVILLIVMIFCIGEMISMVRKGPDGKE